MGHWAEGRLPELKEKLGISGDEQDAKLLRYARAAQSEIELLTGHRFEGEPLKLHIDPGGLPFVPTLDAQTATLRAAEVLADRRSGAPRVLECAPDWPSSGIPPLGHRPRPKH